MTAYVYPEGQDHPDRTINCPCRPTLSYEGLALTVTHNPATPEQLVPEPEREWPVPGASYGRNNWRGNRRG